MANHVKPSKEELQRNMNASLEKLKALPSTPEPTLIEPPSALETPPPPVPPAPPAPGNIDWETKYKESTREAQIMGYKNKEINKAMEDANSIVPPTDEEMKAVYSNFDELDPVMKDLARENQLNKKRFEVLKQATDKFKQVDDWSNKVNDYLDNPQTLIDHPELEGKIEEFKLFVSKPSRRNVDFEDLILAFSGELSKIVTLKKGQMFEQGTPGPSTPPTPSSNKLTLAQAAQLRKTDYKKFLELLRAGKVDSV